MSNSLKNKSFLTGKQKAMDVILVSFIGLFAYINKPYDSQRGYSGPISTFISQSVALCFGVKKSVIG
jgi:hypothetical protein